MKFIDKKLIKKNFYSTYYFLKTNEILNLNNIKHISTMQWKTNDRVSYIACGSNEIIEILKASIPKSIIKKMIIKYAPEGSFVGENQCVLSITGRYKDFCHLENIIDGVLARRCSVATNCAKILTLVDSDKIIFMSDRSDDYRLHPYDGYAAYVAGIRNFSNESHIKLIDDNSVKIFGSMPHALIHQYNGDIVATYKAYKRHPHYDGVILVDFNNDVLEELKKLRPYYHDIKGIRLDTSISLIDKTLKKEKINLYGVNHILVKLTRMFLDQNDGKHIKIIVSSNNNYNTIKELEDEKAEVDYYGIGTYLTRINLHFTADLVVLNGKEFAKCGREKLDESNLIKLNAK